MRNAIGKNELFRRHLQARTGSVLIRTADHSAGRLYVFSKGHLFTKADRHGDADVRMIWKDAGTAFRAMISNDPQTVTRAIDCGDLRVEGDISVAQWFGTLIKALKDNGKHSKGQSLESVAVVGLGKMGSGLARNIQNAGFDLVVFNRTSAKAKPFIENGAHLAKSPGEAASMARIVVSSLMDDSSVREIVTAKGGLLSGMTPGGIHLCATTISPDLAKELTQLHRQHGSHFVTGAVVGRPDAAEAGELLSLMAGDKKSVEQCKPVCSAYSNATLVIGEEPCLANYAKLSLNYFAVANIELMGQLYAYGDTVGIGRRFYEQVFEASFANPTLKMYSQKIMARDFMTDVGFELSGGVKDVRLMLAASNATSRSLDYAPIIIAKMEEALALGWQTYDWSTFTNISARNSVQTDR